MIDRRPAKKSKEAKVLSQSDELALYDHVGRASIQHLRDRTAGILIETGDGGVDCGTAVAVQIEGRMFLLTAAHNVKDVDKDGTRFTFFSANGSSKEPLTVIDSNFNAAGADGSNDVAWLEVDVESANRSNLVGTDIRSIDLTALNADEMCFLIGFPAAFAGKSRDANGALNIIAPMMLYFTHVKSDDGVTIVIGYGSRGYQPEQGVKEMPTPSGMSGGGVWCSPQELTADGEILDAGRFKLVGLTLLHWKKEEEVHAIKIVEALKLLMKDKPELKEALRPIAEA